MILFTVFLPHWVTEEMLGKSKTSHYSSWLMNMVPFLRDSPPHEEKPKRGNNYATLFLALCWVFSLCLDWSNLKVNSSLMFTQQRSCPFFTWSWARHLSKQASKKPPKNKTEAGPAYGRGNDRIAATHRTGSEILIVNWAPELHAFLLSVHLLFVPRSSFP